MTIRELIVRLVNLNDLDAEVYSINGDEGISLISTVPEIDKIHVDVYRKDGYHICKKLVKGLLIYGN